MHASGAHLAQNALWSFTVSSVKCTIEQQEMSETNYLKCVELIYNKLRSIILYSLLFRVVFVDYSQLSDLINDKNV